MSALKNRMFLITAVGIILMGQSVLWEYVRVRPNYRFVISPWSLRGYQTTQGTVIVAIAALLLALLVVLGLGIVKEKRSHALILTGVVTALATIVTALSDAKDVDLGGLGALLFSVVGAAAIDTLVNRFIIPQRLSVRVRRPVRIVLWLVSLFGLLIGVLGPFFDTTTPMWQVILLAYLLIAVLAVFRHPESLTQWRLLINSLTAVWLVSLTSAASLRQTLLRLQLEENGVAAELLDVQITAGLLIAWLGGLIAMVGAVGLWAKRRERIDATDRARRQIAAARESEEEYTAS